MTNKIIGIFLAVFVMLPVNSMSGVESKDSGLQIYLPREMMVEGDVADLGQIAIMRGDETLAGKARAVTVGRISMLGQKIILDRSILLSRLACSGIDVSRVTLTGAEEITVSRQHQIIKGSEFTKSACDFLKANLPDKSICQFDAINTVEDVVLPGKSEDIKLSCRLVASGTGNPSKVRIAAICDGNEIAVRQMGFRFKYNCRTVVAKVDIQAGAVISPENVRISKAVSNTPEPANWSAPYGFVAKRQLPANTIIMPNMTAAAVAPVVLKRNQSVIIKINVSGLFISANGKAMQDGRIGEFIKVQNIDSQRIIMAKVCEDGTVEPAF